MTATDTTEAAFLNRIRGTADDDHATRMRLLADDAPRLIYADWLDDHEAEVGCKRCNGVGIKGPSIDEMLEILTRLDIHGRIEQYIKPKLFDYKLPPKCEACSGSGTVSNGCAARAEFIRLGCELATMERRHYLECTSTIKRSMESSALRSRHDALLREHGERLIRDVFRLPTFHSTKGTGWQGPNSTAIYVQFSRGFISSVTTTVDSWLVHGSAIVRARCAAVERVEFSDKRPLEMPSGRFAWYGQTILRRAMPVASFSDLPLSVWSLLDDYDGFDAEIDKKWYDSEQAARDALSAACIASAWRKI